MAVAAAVGVASAGSPFGGGRRSIAYWHLFGGGDGVRMREMLGNFAKQGTGIEVAELILPWGNPYYTKLSLAATGGRPPFGRGGRDGSRGLKRDQRASETRGAAMRP